jgi:hypothetical protein
VSDRNDSQPEAEREDEEDLELRQDDAATVAGGAKADTSRDAGLHMKYDLKAQKEG